MIVVEIIILLLLTGAIVYLYIASKKANEQLQDNIKVLKHEHETIKKEMHKIDEQNDQISQLNKQYAVLKKNHEKIINELALLKNFMDNHKQNNLQINNKPAIRYFVKPIDNAFPEELQSYTPEGTVYKLEINHDNKSATFIIHHNGANITDIIKRSESYVKPACTELNMPDKECENIVTHAPGKAFLENNLWMIKQKATISYE